MSGAHLSKDFFELIKNIGECKSKQEEEKIVSNEVAALRQRLSESPASVGLKRSKEAIVRVMYVEMLGHSADFGHIHAVNMTQQNNLLCKRVGYLACSLCLHPEHELITLLVNTVRRDLRSSNHLEVCAALIAVSKLVNNEIMPAVIECITELLDHTHEVVRKKAVMALHRLHVVQPGSLSSMTDKLRRVLCDKDPAVMGASLHALHVLIVEEPAAYKDLVPSFVSILKQITEHRLPSSFDYHRMPAPWIQIKLLQVLATLGTADQGASEHMFEVLYDVLKRADTGINIGFAVVYECVRTITAIYPNVQLMETAANHISRFVSSENHNLKYLGIKSLASIVQVNQKYALEHQLVVVECMEDSDETLKRKTLDLLFKMTNAANVVFVVDKLVHHLRQTTDVHFRSALVDRITQLAERYAPDNAWFITTMNSVFELGGDVVQQETVHNLLRLIAEGGGEDDDADTELRLHAVNAYHALLGKAHIPEVLMKVVCWTLGEYGYLSDDFELEDLLETLCDVMDRQFAEPDTRCWIMSAITKLVAQLPSVPEEAVRCANKYCASQSITLQQYCTEFLALVKDPAIMPEVLPVDASCDDLEVDPALGFLDGFVSEAIAAGAQRYLPVQERPDEMQIGGTHSGSANASGGSQVAGGGLRFDEYAKPEESVRAIGGTGLGELMAQPAGGGASSGLNTVGVAKRWGADGYVTTGDGPPGQAAPPPAQPAPTPPPPQACVSSAAPPAPYASPKPVVMSEKEKMAAALFSGMGQTARAAAAEAHPRPPAAQPIAPSPPGPGSGAGASAAAPVPKKEVKEKKAKKKKEKEANSGSVGDLLGDLLDVAPGGPAPAGGALSANPNVPVQASAPPPPAAQSNSPTMDLLSLADTMLPASGTGGNGLNAPQTPQPAQVAGPLAATGTAACSSAASSVGACSLTAGSSCSPLAGALMDGAHPAPQMGGMPPPHVGSVPLAPMVPNPVGGPRVLQASGQPQSPTPLPLSPGSSRGGPVGDRTLLAGDGHVELSARRELAPESVKYTLVLTNLTHSHLRNVGLSVEPPSQLRVALAPPPAGAELRGHRVTQPALQAGQATSQAFMFSCADTPTPQMRIAGFVSYVEAATGQQEQRNLSFHLNISVEEMIRPHKVNTQQFGEIWGQHSSQKKFTVATKTITDTKAYMLTIEAQLRLAPVQVIGMECIASGVLVGSGSTILLHAKVGVANATAIEVTVRTKDGRISDAVQRLCMQILAR